MRLGGVLNKTKEKYRFAFVTDHDGLSGSADDLFFFFFLFWNFFTVTIKFLKNL